jgi:hypothetical protein
VVETAKVATPWLSYCSAQSLETSEFLSILHPNSFWTFLERLANGEAIDQVASSLLSPTERELLKKATKYRLYSGEIVVHERLRPQDAPECETFAVYQGESVCNPENLGKSISTLKQNNSDFTENYGHILGDQGSIVVLYSKIGSPSFLPFHRILRKAALEGEVRYVYRHLVHRDCSDPADDELSGFGLELEMKEYGPTPITVDTEHGQYRLEDPVYAKNIEQFGLQVLQTILDSSKPLESLSFLSENAPMLVKHLSTVRPTKDVIEKATMLAQHFNLPETIISINGAEVQSLHFELQTLLEFLNEYQSLLKRFLVTFADHEMVGRQLMASSLQVAPFRFDVRTSAAIVLNDLSRDQRYKQWPRSFRALMRPPSGQFYPLARNVVALTMVMDLDSFPSSLLEDIVRVVGQMIPVQMVLVLTSNDDSLTAAVYAVYRQYGRIAIVAFLKRVFRRVDLTG